MPLSEQVEQVNRQLATHLATIVDELRRAMLARLREAHTSALDRLEEIHPQLPASPLAPELLADLEARLTPPPAPAPRPTSTELLAAFRRIDGASTQSELLEGLLHGARRFCGRSALYILAEEGTRGWAAAGFGPALTALEDSTPDTRVGSPLARLAEGAGVLRLAAEECATLVGEFSAEPAAGGALVPLVLRDRLAAGLYVDRLADDEEIDLPAIQALSYGAAQALELLGLRERSATSTLFVVGEAAALAPLPLWRETIDEEMIEPEPLPAVDEVASTSFATSPSATPEFAVPEPVVEPVWIPAPVTPAVSAPIFAPEPEVVPAAPAVDEFKPLEAAPIEFAPEPIAAPAFELEPAEAPADVWEPALDDTAAASVTVAEAGEAWSEPVFELALEEEQTFELVTEEPPATEPTFAAPVEEIPVPVEPPALPEPSTSLEPAGPSEPSQQPAPTLSGFERPAEETTAPLPAQPFPWSSAASTQQVPVTPPSPVRADLSEDETVMIPRSGFPPAAAVGSPFATGPTPVPATPSLAGGWPASERSAGGRTSEVAPPSDLQGPGWAFSGSRTQVGGSGDEALHEEARRLARLLVSEIKLYNEEQVEDGRRHKDIYARLKDDIDRSRQLYEERVHERVRTTTDYFQQELVRNLAGGDPSALGR